MNTPNDQPMDNGHSDEADDAWEEAWTTELESSPASEELPSDAHATSAAPPSAARPATAPPPPVQYIPLETLAPAAPAVGTTSPSNGTPPSADRPLTLSEKWQMSHKPPKQPMKLVLAGIVGIGAAAAAFILQLAVKEVDLPFSLAPTPEELTRGADPSMREAWLQDVLAGKKSRACGIPRLSV